MNDLTQTRWQQIDTLFDKALGKSKKERDLFLQKMCGTDTDLLNHVEKLLQVYDEAQEILGESVTTFAAPLIPGLIDQLSGKQQVSSGSRIGSYEILEELGYGGMGSVYLAKKKDAPYQKQVALKLIHPGMNTDGVLRRFRNEGQILASLEHSNIARLYDGGMHTDGRPFFIMERIKGEPIDIYCDKHKLPIKERLRLFITVCEAVQYAHQNLVVHRDIKPAHVLVTAEGKIKLVDFGIAKLLEPEQMKLNTHQTQTGVKVMTPEFAAPEQVRGESVTTASDIYSLGVLLYLVLTGRRPYNLNTNSMLEIERIVCQTEPIRPSEAVTGVSIPAAVGVGNEQFDPVTTAKLRGKRVEDLKRELSGDLDQIVLMALRKEPERRYQSALAVVDDIQNYLQARPIQARPSALKYRITKFAKRNRWAVLGAAAAVISIFAGLGIALWQANIARLERDTAQREAAKARAAQDYLIELFETADPAENQGEQITVMEIVERGIARLEEDLADEPEVHVEMLKVLGRVEQALGDFDLSAKLLEESLIMTRELRGEEHLDVAAVKAMLAEVLRWDGEFDRAEILFREALAIRHRFIEGDNTEIAINMDRLARTLEMKGDFKEAEFLYREALAMHERLLGENSEAVSGNLNNLGWLLYQMGEREESERALRKSLEIKKQIIESPNPAISSTLSNLAVVLRAKGEYLKAEEFAEQALQQEIELYGEDHPRVTTAMSNRSLILLDMARYKEAAEQYRQILDNNRRQLGPSHIYVAFALSSLAMALIEDGQGNESFPLLDEAVEIFQQAVGQDHRYYARSLAIKGLAMFYQNPAQAKPIFDQSVRILSQAVGTDHPDLARVLSNLGRVQVAIGEFHTAEITFRKALKIQREALSAHHTNTIWTLINLGHLLTELRQMDEAEQLLLEALEASATTLPEDHWQRIAARLELGACLKKSGQSNAAQREIDQVLAALKGRTDFHAVRLQARANELIHLK